MFISHYNGHGIKLVRLRPLSTVDNTRDYARVSHSRQWSNYNIFQGRIQAWDDRLYSVCLSVCPEVGASYGLEKQSVSDTGRAITKMKLNP